MTSTIITKNSSTASSVPLAADLTQGELAVNVTDKKLYSKDSGGSVVKLVGSLGNQEANAAAITGGTINGTAIGGTTAAAVSATTLSASSTLSVTGAGSIQGLTVGRGAGAVATNTAVGASALAANTSGSENTAVGYQALISETSATNNSAFGVWALRYNTTGSSNVAVGRSALEANTTASNNTAVGYQAGYSNTTGTALVAVGNLALDACTTGNRNTAVGDNSLGALTTGDNNTSIGRSSGLALTTGVNNTFVGAYNGSTGGCGELITTGSKNTIIGSYNGNQGGLDIRTASNYIVLSDGDGNPRGIFDGSGNLFVGVTSQIGSGKISVPYSSSAYGIAMKSTTADAANYAIEFKNSSNSGVGAIYASTTTTTYATSSDYRLKENIAPMTGALNTVAQLKPCTYTWKENNSSGQGFIAHELQAVVPDAVVGEKDAVDAEGNPVYQGIDTSFLVATLTAAIQELKAEFDAYKASHP